MDDWLIFTPGDIDLRHSPLWADSQGGTYVQGCLNPALTRLPGGNLLLMVRVAEALVEPIADDCARVMRWTADGYTLDSYPLNQITMDDPRWFDVHGNGEIGRALTQMSWLLPVEITGDGQQIVAIHYDKAIAPSASNMALGMGDARISVIGGIWYMTVSAISDARVSTLLYKSMNGLDYRYEGIVQDHHTNGMCLFEGRLTGRYMAISQPIGPRQYAGAPDSGFADLPGFQIQQSPDVLHWRPLETPAMRIGRGMGMSIALGTPPLLTREGWLMLYQGIALGLPNQAGGETAMFWALLDREDPSQLIATAQDAPLIQADAALTRALPDQPYLPAPSVVSGGMIDLGDCYLIASSEAGLACRMSVRMKRDFTL